MPGHLSRFWETSCLAIGCQECRLSGNTTLAWQPRPHMPARVSRGYSTASRSPFQRGLTHLSGHPPPVYRSSHAGSLRNPKNFSPQLRHAQIGTYESDARAPFMMIP
jgi:hypothetical protein